jgi:hypothetical protein
MPPNENEIPWDRFIVSLLLLAPTPPLILPVLSSSSLAANRRSPFFVVPCHRSLGLTSHTCPQNATRYSATPRFALNTPPTWQHLLDYLYA